MGGDAYFDFVDRFVTAVKRVLPGVLLQWEDFARDHAAPLLERYRDQLCTFNDDIQGTASMVVASLTGALGVTGGRFRDQNIVIAGAGSAGIGLAAYLLEAMRTEGLSADEARRRLFLVDRQGLIHDRIADLTLGQRVYAQPFDAVASFRRDESGRISLEAVLEATGATVLLGVSAQLRTVRREGGPDDGRQGRPPHHLSPLQSDSSAARRPPTTCSAGRMGGRSSPPAARTRR